MVKLDRLILSSSHSGFMNELPIIDFSMTVSGSIAAGFTMFTRDITVPSGGLISETSYKKQGGANTYYLGQSPLLLDIVWGSNVWIFSGYIDPTTIRFIIFVNGVGSPTVIATQTYDFRLFLFKSPLNP